MQYRHFDLFKANVPEAEPFQGGPEYLSTRLLVRGRLLRFLEHGVQPLRTAAVRYLKSDRNKYVDMYIEKDI